MDRKCSDCDFSNVAKDYTINCQRWDSFCDRPEGVSILTCRRYAPRAAILNSRASLASYRADIFWPTVVGNDFCGEFQPKEPGETEEKAADVNTVVNSVNAAAGRIKSRRHNIVVLPPGDYHLER